MIKQLLFKYTLLRIWGSQFSHPKLQHFIWKNKTYVIHIFPFIVDLWVKMKSHE